MWFDLSAKLLGGLGLFFIGIKLISSHLKQLSGHRFRNLMVKAVGSPWRSALLGLGSGALTQSTNAVTFIAISIIAAGALTVSKAMPVVAMANVGTSVLVLVATFNLQIFVLFLAGLVGVGYYLDIDKSPRFRHPAGAVLGVALLFMGLQLIKTGAAPLQEMELVQNFLSSAAQSYILVFTIGALITAVAQSSSTVSVVAVTMTGVGLLTMGQSMLVIYGASLGSALSILFLSSNLRGTARQLAWFQVLLKITGVLFMLTLFIAELAFGVPLVRVLVESLTAHVATQAALVYLIFQISAAALILLLSKPAYALLCRVSPPTQAEELARPQYLYRQALEEATTALDLVEKEQVRLTQYLAAYVPNDEGSSAPEQISVLFPANQDLAAEVKLFITELMDRHQDRELLDRMVNLQSRNALIVELQSSLFEFSQRIQPLLAESEPMSTGRQLCESLHALTLTFADAIESGDTDDMTILRGLTSDRSDLMENLRNRLLSDDIDRSHEMHEALYLATSLFERIVWLMRRYVVLCNK